MRSCAIPALRATLLAEQPTHRNPQMLAFMRSVGNMYVLGDPPNYTPPAESRLDKRATQAGGVTPLELAYDLLVSGDGRTILLHPGANYRTPPTPTWRACCTTTDTVMALGDGGAHYGHDLRRELHHARADLLDARPHGRALAASRGPCSS